MFIALLSFIGPLANKSTPLKNEPCISRSTLIDLNPTQLNYFLFMISLDICNGSCNAVDYLPSKTCIPSEKKDVNVKVFNMIKRLNEVKTWVEYISCDFKWKFDSRTCNSNLNGTMINVNVSVKRFACEKKYYSWNTSRSICENRKYSKSLFDNPEIVHDDESHEFCVNVFS